MTSNSSNQQSMSGLIKSSFDEITSTTATISNLSTTSLNVTNDISSSTLLSTTGTIDTLSSTDINISNSLNSSSLISTDASIDNVLCTNIDSTNFTTTDTTSSITYSWNISDGYEYVPEDQNTTVLSFTVPQKSSPKTISFSMPIAFKTNFSRTSSGTISYTYNYFTSGTSFYKTTYKLYKNGVYVEDITTTSDASTTTQYMTITATGVSGFGSGATWYIFIGNLSSSFTTDYDATQVNIYTVRFYLYDDSSFTATGTGLLNNATSVILNTSNNYAYVSPISSIFVITTYPTPLNLQVNKYVNISNNAKVGTSAVDNLYTNEIISGEYYDKGFGGESQYPRINDYINLTGSIKITNAISAPSLFSTSSIYDYSYTYTATNTSTSTTTGNVNISRNNTVSNNNSILLSTINVSQYYQNTDFTATFPLSFIATFTSTTSLLQNPTWINTQSINWTSSNIKIYKNGALWKTTNLTAPSGSISSVVVSTSPSQPVNTTYSYSYTVFIGNVSCVFTPDYNINTTNDVYTIYLFPSMSFQSNQTILSTVSGTFTLGLNNATTTSSYTITGTNIVNTPSNYASNYSAFSFIEDIFQNPTTTGTTIVNTLNSTDIDNTNVVDTKYIGYNYTSIPTYSNSRLLGYQLSASNTSNTNVGGTPTNVCSFTLPVGGWIITLRGFFNTPATNTDYLELGFTATSATFSNNFRTTYTPNQSFGDFYFNHTFYYNNTAQRTIWFIAQSFTGGIINSGADMIAIRLH
jgi:hypothetical protein